VRLSVLLAFCAFVVTPAYAQTELTGPERDVARAAIVYPVVFDPLLTMPLTPGPEGVIDVHGSDIVGTAHIAVRNRDDSYGIIASAPLSSSADPSTSVDPRGMRRHASLGFHLTNVIWHPKARVVDGVAGVDSPWALFIHADYRFNRAEYEFVDALTRERKTDTRLNDTATMLFGAQVFARPHDPGYFFGFSYTYSAVFQGQPADLPAKIRGNLLRVEMRRPFTAVHMGFNPSFTYEKNSGAKTVDATTYVRMGVGGRSSSGNLEGPHFGLRLGHESEHDGRGGFFATVFAGWEGWMR
jgi:hypothetical protein